MHIYVVPSEASRIIINTNVTSAARREERRMEDKGVFHLNPIVAGVITQSEEDDLTADTYFTENADKLRIVGESYLTELNWITYVAFDSMDDLLLMKLAIS